MYPIDRRTQNEFSLADFFFYYYYYFQYEVSVQVSRRPVPIAEKDDMERAIECVAGWMERCG
jgi:hypothetical protein